VLRKVVGETPVGEIAFGNDDAAAREAIEPVHDARARASCSDGRQASASARASLRHCIEAGGGEVVRQRVDHGAARYSGARVHGEARLLVEDYK